MEKPTNTIKPKTPKKYFVGNKEVTAEEYKQSSEKLKMEKAGGYAGRTQEELIAQGLATKPIKEIEPFDFDKKEEVIKEPKVSPKLQAPNILSVEGISNVLEGRPVQFGDKTIQTGLRGTKEEEASGITPEVLGGSLPIGIPASSMALVNAFNAGQTGAVAGGTSSAAVGSGSRALGTNPRALGTNPRALLKAATETSAKTAQIVSKSRRILTLRNVIGLGGVATVLRTYGSGQSSMLTQSYSAYTDIINNLNSGAFTVQQADEAWVDVTSSLNKTEQNLKMMSKANVLNFLGLYDDMVKIEYFNSMTRPSIQMQFIQAREGRANK